MRTHYTYQLDLKDIDPARIRLVEKKYAIGEAQLKEGKTTWFEVQLFTREDKLLIKKQDIESRQAEQLSSFSLIVGDKESAKKAIALLKRGINELLQ